MFEKSEFFGYEQYTLRNESLELSVISLGAAITVLRYHGEDAVLHFENAEGYEKGYCFLNFIVGRYGNRIKDGKVTISGKEYQLDCNERGNQLHGGSQGFHTKQWTLLAQTESSFTLGCTSPDGENGYPGELKAQVIYSLNGDTMSIHFKGVSDADTIFAPTTHTYFCLSKNCLDTRLMLNASTYLPTDRELMPLAITPVDEKFDFRALRTIGENYDHCFIADGLCSALMMGDSIAIRYRSDFPAMQLYTGSFMKPAFENNAGFALEPEFCPNSPNRSDFLSPVLEAGKEFDRFVEYMFSKVEDIIL